MFAVVREDTGEPAILSIDFPNLDLLDVRLAALSRYALLFSLTVTAYANRAHSAIGVATAVFSQTRLLTWPIKFIRSYGQEKDIFSIEAGRKCPNGEGQYFFHILVCASSYTHAGRQART